MFNLARFNSQLYIFGGYIIGNPSKIQPRNVFIFDFNKNNWTILKDVLPDYTRY